MRASSAGVYGDATSKKYTNGSTGLRPSAKYPGSSPGKNTKPSSGGTFARI